MARNDVVLLDSLVEKARLRLGENRDEPEVFELFCFEQLLKDYDLSYDELEDGWTDGTNDGGVDGFFVFVDGKLATEDVLKDVIASASRQGPHVGVVVFTVRRSDSFRQQPLNSLCNSLPELFDLRKAEYELAYPFSESVLTQRAAFLTTFVALADRRPTLKIQVYYCSRGDTTTLADNLISRGEQLLESMRGLFSHVVASVEFKGAAELLELARRQPVYSLRLKFIESYISREGKNYVVLATLRDYFAFISDEVGQLRRYLFESNVRDYLGGQINNDITQTLQRGVNADVEDFWWLNNGVTILATHATVIGKEISLENVQIVNGLQTTETIHRYFLDREDRTDDRSILIKIILTSDEAARARIIKATNYQNPVELSSLRGLDKIQQNIEEFLADHGWFYDRRKNFYKNQGKPADRIVSIPYLAAAVRAVALGDPASSQRQRARSLKNDHVYAQVFDPSWDLNVYLASLEITRRVQAVFDTPPITLVHHVGFIYACSRLGTKDYKPSEVAQLAGQPPTEEEVLFIRDELIRAESRLLGTNIAISDVTQFAAKQYSGDEVSSLRDDLLRPDESQSSSQPIKLDLEIVQQIVKDLYAEGRRLFGTVKRVVSERSYGFIEGADGRDYFFHRSDLKGHLVLNDELVGCLVEFDIKRPAYRTAGAARTVRKRMTTSATKETIPTKEASV